MSRQLDSEQSNSGRWVVWRSKRNSYVSVAEFAGPTAEEAVARAVDHELARYPVKECSGMYWAIPAGSMVRVDYGVSYEKRDITGKGAAQ